MMNNPLWRFCLCLLALCVLATASHTLARAETASLTPKQNHEFEIAGFYGAANNGGTFVRTVEKLPIQVGDQILVAGTEYYDGTWKVLQAFPYKDPRDSRSLWGYRIEPKWRGFPPGFTIQGDIPVNNRARLQLFPSAPRRGDP